MKSLKGTTKMYSSLQNVDSTNFTISFLGGGGLTPIILPRPRQRACFLYRCQNRKIQKLHGLWRRTVDRNAFSGKVVPDSDLWSHDLQNSKSTLLIIYGIAVTTWPQNLISSSSSPTPPKLYIWWNSHKRYVGYRICKLLYMITCTHTDGRTDQEPEHKTPSAAKV